MSGLAGDTMLHVHPGIASRRIVRITGSILSQDLIVPRWWLGYGGLIGDVIPQLLHQEKFFGGRQAADLSSGDRVHGENLDRFNDLVTAERVLDRY